MSGPLTCQLPLAGNAQKTLITPFQCCKGFAFWAPRTPQRECPAILLLCACLLQVCKRSCNKLGMSNQFSPHEVLFIAIQSLCTCLERLTFKIHAPITCLVSLKLALPWHVRYHSPARLALIFKDQKPRAAAAIACNCQHLAPKPVVSMSTHNSMNNQHHFNQLKSCIRYQSIIIVDIIVKIHEYHFEAMLQGTTSEAMPIYYIFHLQLLASDCRISKMRGLSCYVLFVIQLLKRLNRLKLTWSHLFADQRVAVKKKVWNHTCNELNTWLLTSACTKHSLQRLKTGETCERINENHRKYSENYQHFAVVQ